MSKRGSGELYWEDECGYGGDLTANLKASSILVTVVVVVAVSSTTSVARQEVARVLEVDHDLLAYPLIVLLPSADIIIENEFKSFITNHYPIPLTLGIR